MKPPELHTIQAFITATDIFKKVPCCGVHRCSYMPTNSDCSCENPKCIINARGKEQYIMITHILEEES